MPGAIVVLCWYLLFSVLLFAVSNYMADKSINNMFLYHLFSLAEVIFLSFFFRKILKTPLIRKAIPYFILLFILVFVFSTLFLEKLDSFNSNTSGIEFLIIIIFCMAYYFQLANSDEILFFTQNPIFWIVSGLFIYYASSMMMFALYKYAAESNKDFVLNFWMFQVIMYLVKNILITKGILCFKVSKSTFH